MMDDGEQARLVAVARRLAAPSREGLAPNSRESVVETFNAYGIAVTNWAKYFGFAYGNVQAVLRGPEAIRGEKHKIAILLGMKTQGVIVEEDAERRKRMRLALGDARVKEGIDV